LIAYAVDFITGSDVISVKTSRSGGAIESNGLMLPMLNYGGATSVDADAAKGFLVDTTGPVFYTG